MRHINSTFLVLTMQLHISARLRPQTLWPVRVGGGVDRVVEHFNGKTRGIEPTLLTSLDTPFADP